VSLPRGLFQLTCPSDAYNGIHQAHVEYSDYMHASRNERCRIHCLSTPCWTVRRAILVSSTVTDVPVYKDVLKSPCFFWIALVLLLCVHVSLETSIIDRRRGVLK
jgi:hypothetical protein